MANAQMNGGRGPQPQRDDSSRPQTQQQGATTRSDETERPQMGGQTSLTDWASI